MSDRRKKTSIARRILAWYAREKRNLPWRKTRDPYRVWVSEVMLQQTRVETVIPYYRRFLKDFPTVKALAKAPLDDVLKVWENLGYYSRARHLHEAAVQIVERFGGVFPSSREAILSLPGIGPYTAGAVLSIAFGKPSTAVDGNVRRVLSRLFALKEPVNVPSGLKQTGRLAEEILPAGRAGDFNQALMDLGATICRPAKPGCGQCPVRTLCLAFEQGRQEMLPTRSKARPIPHRDMTAAVVKQGQAFLLVQRKGGGLLGGLWKFPGGLRKEGETLEDCLTRTVRGETGLDVRCTGGAIAAVDHAYSHFRVTLHAFPCRIRNGPPKTVDCAGWRWASADDLASLAFSKADREILRAVAAGPRNARSDRCGKGTQ